MPGDTEIITQWRELAEVDYFSQFIKIWIAFNAWMRTLDHTITKDRALINKVNLMVVGSKGVLRVFYVIIIKIVFISKH